MIKIRKHMHLYSVFLTLDDATFCFKFFCRELLEDPVKYFAINYNISSFSLQKCILIIFFLNIFSQYFFSNPYLILLV